MNADISAQVEGLLHRISTKGLIETDASVLPCSSWREYVPLLIDTTRSMRGIPTYRLACVSLTTWRLPSASAEMATGGGSHAKARYPRDLVR